MGYLRLFLLHKPDLPYVLKRKKKIRIPLYLQDYIIYGSSFYIFLELNKVKEMGHLGNCSLRIYVFQFIVVVLLNYCESQLDVIFILLSSI